MNIKTKLLLYLFLFTSTLTFTLSSCSSSPTDPGPLPSVTLTVDGVTSTEAFIKLSTNNISLPASVILSRNNKQINSFTLITTDTTIVDNNLNPNQSYTYSAELTDADNKMAASGSVLVQTMDTTSHNFTWQTFTFGGQGGSSTLFDVAIINENDIWAVGEMYVYDSTGTPVLYNAVHWDGSKWELKRIKTEFRGNIITIELEGIFAFSPTDIWMVGSLPIHGDGQNWTMFDVRTTTDPNLSLSKAWGANTNDMYFVGRGGSIAHYNGSGWQKINSGTDLNVNDIWGDFNKETGKWEILAVASNGGTKKLIRIEGLKATFLQDIGLVQDIHSIWFIPEKHYYIVGAGIYQKRLLSDSLWNGYPQGVVTSYYSGAVRGNGLNNIFVLGAYFEVAHFNGISWRLFRDEFPVENGLFGRIAVSDNINVMVGFKGQYAIIAVGKR